MGSLEVPDPAAFLSFQSHNEAAAALESVGYAHARAAPPFTAEELVDAVNELLRSRGITVMDMTTAVPDTAHAAYKALLVAGFHAAASCRKDENAAFLILRTPKNTPSFLFGHHWQMAQALGKEGAELRVRASPTPAAVVVYRDRQICLPSSVFDTNVLVTSRLVAHEITMEAEFFSCELCKRSCVESRVGSCVQVAEIGVSPCGKIFRKFCVRKELEQRAARSELEEDKQ